MTEAELAFELDFAEYADECRAAGIEPLSFDALRETRHPPDRCPDGALMAGPIHAPTVL